MAEKREFKKQAKMSKIAEVQKITRAKITTFNVYHINDSTKYHIITYIS